MGKIPITTYSHQPKSTSTGGEDTAGGGSGNEGVIPKQKASVSKLTEA